MNLSPRILFLSVFLLPVIVTAADNPESSVIDTLEKSVEQLDSLDGIGYGDNVCDVDDDDEEALPENVIAVMYENGRMAFLFGQFDVAFKAWEPLAQQGFSKAQASLGWMYHTGNGVKKDIQQAIGWYELAADQGHAIAQNNLGVFYENGLGVIPDDKTAFKWYEKSAKTGYPFAQYNLGKMYAEGRGVGKNKEEALYWLRSASRHKVKEATEMLALLENKPVQKTDNSKPKKKVAHAPYHSNPVAKGINWVKSQANNHYTIQLARSQDLNWILKLAASEQLPEPIIQVQSTEKNSGDWYNLIYGSFPSFKEAEAAKKSLPESLKKWSPKLLRFGEVHELIKK